MPVVIALGLGLAFSYFFGPLHSIHERELQRPARCAYFEEINAPENKAFCQRWFADHPDAAP